MSAPAPRPVCLTDAEMATIASAPPGQAPPEAAAHLAGCARCQRRLLALSGEVAAAPAGRPATRPPVWRTVVAVLFMLIAVLTALYGMSWLGRQG